MWTPSLLVLEILQFCLAGLWLASFTFSLPAALFWNRDSGSARQIKFEMRAELLQVLLPFTIFLSISLLFLTIHTADGLAPFLTGAMCAFAVFTFTGYGTAVLAVQIVLAVFTGLWLVFNHIDRLNAKQPFFRLKLAVIPPAAGLFLVEITLFFLWLGEMDPDTLVSCCGDLFSTTSQFALPMVMNALENPLTLWLFALLVLVHFASGGMVLVQKRLVALFSATSFLLLPFFLLITTLYISQYAYENPVHRCPFCLLQEPDAICFWLLYLLSGVTAICGGGCIFFLLREKFPKDAIFAGACNRLVVTVLCATTTVLLLMGYVILMSNYQYN